MRVSESNLAGAAHRHGLSSKANQKLNFSNWQLLPIRPFRDFLLCPCLPPPSMPGANDAPTSAFCASNSLDRCTCSQLVTTLKEHISLAHNPRHSNEHLPTPSHHLLPPTYHYSNCYYLYTDIGNGDYGHGGRGQDV